MVYLLKRIDAADPCDGEAGQLSNGKETYHVPPKVYVDTPKIKRVRTASVEIWKSQQSI